MYHFVYVALFVLRPNCRKADEAALAICGALGLTADEVDEGGWRNIGRRKSMQKRIACLGAKGAAERTHALVKVVGLSPARRMLRAEPVFSLTCLASAVNKRITFLSSLLLVDKERATDMLAVCPQLMNMSEENMMVGAKLVQPALNHQYPVLHPKHMRHQ